MAKLSRNQRHKARQRKTLGVLKREFRRLYQAHSNATFALLSVMQMYEGQTVTIAAETMKAVLPRLQHLSWASARQDDGSVKLTMVDTTPAAGEPQTPPDVGAVRYVDDETVEESAPDHGPVDAE